MQGREISDRSIFARLTDREGQVLELLSSGSSNREMAARLFVSVKDIEYHVGNVLRKLESRNRTEAVGRAYASGYLSAGSWPPEITPPFDTNETSDP
jgi:DNA-binding NarL/FixJ family response regulator